MNAFNRILVVLLLVMSIPVCTLIFVVPIPVLQTVGESALALATSLEQMDWFVRAPVGVLLALISAVVAIFMLVLEFRRPKAKSVRLQSVSGGQVEVSLKTITDRIAYDVDQLPGVLKTKPSASARKGGVVVEVDVNVAGDTDVPARAAQIVEVVRRAVEQRVGIKLAQPPKVKVQAATSPDDVQYPPIKSIPEPPPTSALENGGQLEATPDWMDPFPSDTTE
jgi:hypothetical protein